MPEIRILHIDDEAATRYTLGRALKRAGYTMMEAETGSEGLRLAQSQPDLIILDVQLPDINGLELARRLKADSATASIPVLQISAALITNEDQALGLEAGADAYLVHPIDPHVLLATVQALLRTKRAEESLAREKERLAVTLASIGEGVITTDARGNVELLNDTAERLTGWLQAEARGQALDDVFCVIAESTRERCAHRARDAMALGQSVELEESVLLVGRGGKEYAITESAAPLYGKTGTITGAVLVFRDVTEKRRLEREAIKVQKLESIGVLAGGIAHDFNNFLTAILGNISLARLPGTDPETLLAEAEQACMRARELTQQLLTFSRGGAPVKRSTCIAELIHESAALALRGSNVRAEFELASELWPVDVDPGQIMQAINNLMINAREAMPRGGKVRIRVENKIIEPGGPLKAGRYVLIGVQDEGAGISSTDLPRIFDPFFTTKETGKGLGLTITYSVVKRHGGLLDVQSRPGAGTLFSLYLPAAEQRHARAPRLKTALPAGSGRILIMDDEVQIQHVACRMLALLGYEAECASDGESAVERYRAALAERRPFDVVVLDLTVPGAMGGRECLSALKALDPGVKAIASSGYATDPIMTNPQRHGFLGMIAKPYEIGAFARTLASFIRTEPAH